MWECLFLLCLWFQKPNISDPMTSLHAEMASAYSVGGGRNTLLFEVVFCMNEVLIWRDFLKLWREWKNEWGILSQISCNVVHYFLFFFKKEGLKLYCLALHHSNIITPFSLLRIISQFEKCHGWGKYLGRHF